jgi:hypothetical protein
LGARDQPPWRRGRDAAAARADRRAGRSRVNRRTPSTRRAQARPRLTPQRIISGRLSLQIRTWRGTSVVVVPSVFRCTASTPCQLRVRPFYRSGLRCRASSRSAARRRWQRCGTERLQRRQVRPWPAGFRRRRARYTSHAGVSRPTLREFRRS